MVLGKGLQKLPTMGSDLQFNVSPIVCILCAPNQALLFTAFAQLDNRVMAQAQPFCRIRDSRRHPVGNAGDL